MANPIVSSYLSRKLRVLSFVGASLVVLIHIPHPTYGKWSVSWWIVDCFCDTVTRTAVPFFFFCSGLLLFRNFAFHWDWWWRAVSKRVKSLLLPFLIANGIMLVYCLARTLLGCILRHRGVDVLSSEALRLLVAATGVDFFAFPLVGATWYIRNLFVLVLLSPVIYVLFVRFRALGVVLLVACAALWMSPLSYRLFFRAGFSLEGLFFFSLGAMTAVDVLNARCVSSSVRRIMTCALPAAFAVGCIARCTDDRVLAMFLKDVSILAMLVSCWYLYDYMKDSPCSAVDRVSFCSFWIYLYQFLPLLLFNPLFYRVDFCGNNAAWFVILLLWLIGSLLLIFMALFLKARFSRIYQILSGGR